LCGRSRVDQSLVMSSKHSGNPQTYKHHIMTNYGHFTLCNKKIHISGSKVIFEKTE